jgi:hypothetical protein
MRATGQSERDVDDWDSTVRRRRQLDPRPRWTAIPECFAWYAVVGVAAAVVDAVGPPYVGKALELGPAWGSAEPLGPRLLQAARLGLKPALVLAAVVTVFAAAGLLAPADLDERDPALRYRPIAWIPVPPRPSFAWLAIAAAGAGAVYEVWWGFDARFAATRLASGPPRVEVLIWLGWLVLWALQRQVAGTKRGTAAVIVLALAVAYLYKGATIAAGG